MSRLGRLERARLKRQLAAERKQQKQGPAERVLGRRRAVLDFDRVETRGVLAGAYRGRDIGERELLTHLVYVKDDRDIAVGCRQPLDNVADRYAWLESEDELAARPTCTTCAKKWDKLKGIRQ